jgi:nucleotide-binding universal stress UspA family protein
MQTRSSPVGIRTPRVVVGTDGSESSRRAIDWASTEAARLGAVLEIHAGWESEFSFADPEKVQRIFEETIDQAVSRVQVMEPGVKVSGFIDHSEPAAALVEASYGADLLVVGSRGRRGFAHMLLGSVSQKCALHAHCPVLIVRPSAPTVVYIRCPVTSAIVPTQLAMDRFTFERAALDDCWSVCPACGRHHRWSKADALLEDGQAWS